MLEDLQEHLNLLLREGLGSHWLLWGVSKMDLMGHKEMDQTKITMTACPEELPEGKALSPEHLVGDVIICDPTVRQLLIPHGVQCVPLCLGF